MNWLVLEKKKKKKRSNEYEYVHVPGGTLKRWRDLAAPAAAAAPGVIKRVSLLCKVFEKTTTLFCHSRIGSSPRSSRPFTSTFSLNPNPLKRFCKCVFGISQPRKKNSFLFFPPATLKSDPAGTGQRFLPRCPEDPHHFQIFISYVPDLRRSSFGITNRSEKRTSNISRNGQI